MFKLLISKLFTSEPSCQDVDGFLADYMEGVLDEETVADFDSHVAKCKMCMQYFEQYKQTVRLTSTAKVEIPEELVSQTLTFIQQNIRR
ncbi:MAG: zf-HC2 domain-containing protein [Rhodothermales bacterium]|nr:zf-HC2 domain-containing protein [Rhodothermales bacterium]